MDEAILHRKNVGYFKISQGKKYFFIEKIQVSQMKSYQELSLIQLWVFVCINEAILFCMEMQ